MTRSTRTNVSSRCNQNFMVEIILSLPTNSVSFGVVAGDGYSDPGHRDLEQGGPVQVPGAVLHLPTRGALRADRGGRGDRAGGVSGMLLHHQGTLLPALHGKETNQNTQRFKRTLFII